MSELFNNFKRGVYMDSVILQNLILTATALITFWIYKSQKWIERRNAAMLLSLQIKEIEKNTLYLKSECMEKEKIKNAQGMYSLNYIFDQNYWEKYRHLLIELIGTNDFEKLERFFDLAIKIKEQQKNIKEEQMQFLKFKSECFYRDALSLYLNGILKNEELKIQKDADQEQLRIQFEVIKDNILKMDYCYREAPYLVNELIPLQYGVTLSEALEEYENITGTVAFEKLIKISSKSSWITLWLWFKFRD
jgi:hypothetical protein